MPQQNPVALLQDLIRFDTTNPPGNEAPCVMYIKQLLDAAGVESILVARDPNRPNLIARLKGRGALPTLMLQGHVDVVTTAHQPWTRQPFSGEIVDGFVWGRGALDMKGGVAMMLSAFLRAKAENTDLPGDVMLVILSDEEAAGTYGAEFLMQEHAELFKGVRWGIGEFGGFTMYVGGKRFYPIQVAEKQVCWLKVRFRGQGGHGSMPVRGGAVAKLGRALTQLDRHRLPVRITDVVRQQVEAVASGLSGVQRLLIRQLLNPLLTDRILDLLGPALATFDPLLHNTVSPTILHGSDKVNVIPSEVALELDARLLPGCRPDDVIEELRPLLGSDAEFEVVRYDEGLPRVDMALFPTLAGALREADPDGIPIPNLLPAVTDGRFFARLGIQHFGFTPMMLPQDFSFTKLIHAADERIPAEALGFGADAIYKVLTRRQV